MGVTNIFSTTFHFFGVVFLFCSPISGFLLLAFSNSWWSPHISEHQNHSNVQFSDLFSLHPYITLILTLVYILLHWLSFQGQAFKIWTFNTMLFFLIAAWFQRAETTSSQSKHYCYFIPQNPCIFIQIFADCLFWDC